MCSHFSILFIFNRNKAFANGLAARGHNVTMISADRDKNAPHGVHYIQMDGLYSVLYDDIVKNAFASNEKNPFEAITEFTDYMSSICAGDIIGML